MRSDRWRTFSTTVTPVGDPADIREGEEGMTQATVARFIGKGLLAGGFLLGTFGLTQEQDIYTQSGLGLLAAGILAMGYSLYLSVTSNSHRQEKR